VLFWITSPFEIFKNQSNTRYLVRSLVRQLLNEMEFEIDKSWTLYLDREGVIDKKTGNDYVKNWSEFFYCIILMKVD
jgi:hypothetical protein